MEAEEMPNKKPCFRPSTTQLPSSIAESVKNLIQMSICNGVTDKGSGELYIDRQTDNGKTVLDDKRLLSAGSHLRDCMPGKEDSCLTTGWGPA